MVNMLSDPIPIELTPEQQVFANDNNQFTLNFLKTVNEVDLSGKSFIYSPLSITYVLGMVNDAAIGQTEKELEETLGFHEGGIQAVNDYCKKLIDGLPKVDDKVTLNIANAIFLNQNYTLKTQFQKDMQTYYDAKAEALNFSSPQTLDHINGWCNEKTKGMIPSILDEVDPAIVSYLVNAIYFKADWASKFDPKNTKDETFTTEKGSTTLPTMHQNVLINYCLTSTFSAVRIPYGNGMWTMTVMLPEGNNTISDVIDFIIDNGFSSIETYPCGTMDDKLPEYILTPHEVDLKLPRDVRELFRPAGVDHVTRRIVVHLIQRHTGEVGRLRTQPCADNMDARKLLPQRLGNRRIDFRLAVYHSRNTSCMTDFRLSFKSFTVFYITTQLRQGNNWNVELLGESFQ